MRVGLVWTCTRNYTIDRPLSQIFLFIFQIKVKAQIKSFHFFQQMICIYSADPGTPSGLLRHFENLFLFQDQCGVISKVGKTF